MLNLKLDRFGDTNAADVDRYRKDDIIFKVVILRVRI